MAMAVLMEAEVLRAEVSIKVWPLMVMGTAPLVVATLVEAPAEAPEVC